MKSIIASGLLLGMAHGAAIAGPYVNVEANSGWTGTDYGGSVIDNTLVLKVLAGICKADLALSLLMVATALLNCLVKPVVLMV